MGGFGTAHVTNIAWLGLDVNHPYKTLPRFPPLNGLRGISLDRMMDPNVIWAPYDPLMVTGITLGFAGLFRVGHRVSGNRDPGLNPLE